MTIVVVHMIGRFPSGSRTGQSNERSNRRYEGLCRQCSEGEKISYYCQACMVCLHPECFQKFHHGKPEEFRPTRPVNPAVPQQSSQI